MQDSKGTNNIVDATPRAIISKKTAPYLFIAPYILLTCVFFIYPLIDAMVLAFHQTNGPRSKVFVGLSNFAFVLSDPDFHKAIKNTVIFSVCSLCLQLPLSLSMALLLNSSKDKVKGIFRLIIFSPRLVGRIFVGVMFTVVFVPRYGLVNRFLDTLLGWGLDMDWLNKPELIIPALILTNLWMFVGFNMIYFLAALQNVDQNLVDAARIDGAGKWSVFWNVTMPSIKPIAVFVLVMSTIHSFQLFELPYALLKNGFGPANSGLFIVSYLYDSAFQVGDLGTGSAVGWILALIIFCISMVQLRITGTLNKDS